MTRLGRQIAPPLVVAVLLALRPALPQRQSVTFRPLLADPHEPGFFAAYLFARSIHLAPRIGSVGLGQTITLVGSRDDRWDLAIAAGVFSQFDIATTTTHLMNTDYIIGIPFSFRWGTQSARVRVYHQSSHLGEEFLDGGVVHRELLSFEAVDALLAREFVSWRIYGGGEYRYLHDPDDLKPIVAHAGVEYGGLGPVVRLGGFGEGRFLAALDAKSFQDRAWQAAWSLKTGLAFTSPPSSDHRVPSWSLLLTAYHGPTPYGQFYRENLSSLGIGFELAL